MLTLASIAILLLALLAACGGDDDATNTPGSTGAEATSDTSVTEEAASDEPTSTAEEETATEPEATSTTAKDEEEEPTATVADSTAVPDDSGERLVGSAVVEDDREDVVNLLMQDPDEPMPGIDLVKVQLEGDGKEMVVTIETAGDIADELSEDVEVSFDVHLWQDGKPAYALSFHHDGTDDWEASVTDFSVGLGDEETIDTEISASGNTLSAAFPGSMLPDLEATFEWYSSVVSSEGGMMIGPNAWFDGAPENVIMLLADPDEFVEFPQ
jgi:hypothetical protein